MCVLNKLGLVGRRAHASQTVVRVSSCYVEAKLAGSQCMGLHSSAGRALQHERRGHVFESS